MRFLLNMNVPRSLGRRLVAAGHECRHAGEIGLSFSGDAAIVEEARTRKETILTHDLDYGHLLAFSGEQAPSVMIFRLRNTHPDNLLTRILSSLREIEEPLLRGGDSGTGRCYPARPAATD